MNDGGIGGNSAIDVDFDELTQFLEELDQKKQLISEHTGALRQRIKEIIEHTGWHKGALADIRKIDAMSDTARADYLRTFRALFDLMMSQVWETEMNDLLAQLEHEGAE